MGEDAAADTLAGLKDDNVDVERGVEEVVGAGQTADAGADDDDLFGRGCRRGGRRCSAASHDDLDCSSVVFTDRGGGVL